MEEQNIKLYMWLQDPPMRIWLYYDDKVNSLTNEAVIILQWGQKVAFILESCIIIKVCVRNKIGTIKCSWLCYQLPIASSKLFGKIN